MQQCLTVKVPEITNIYSKLDKEKLIGNYQASQLSKEGAKNTQNIPLSKALSKALNNFRIRGS